MQVYRFVFMLFFALALVHAQDEAPEVNDPCLAEDYAEANYGTCCAQGGYKKEGHGEICKVVGPKAKGKKEL